MAEFKGWTCFSPDPRKVIVEKQETICTVTEDKSLPNTSLPHLSIINPLPIKKRYDIDILKQNLPNKSRTDTPRNKINKVTTKRKPTEIIVDMGEFRPKRKYSNKNKTNTENSKTILNNFCITGRWRENFQNTETGTGIVLKSAQPPFKCQTIKNKITSTKTPKQCNDFTVTINDSDEEPMKNVFTPKSQQIVQSTTQNNSPFNEQHKPLYNNDVFLGQSSNSVDLPKNPFHNQSNYLPDFSYLKDYLQNCSQLPDFSQIQDCSQFQDASRLQCDSKFHIYSQNQCRSQFQYTSQIQDYSEFYNNSRVLNTPHIENCDKAQKCPTNCEQPDSQIVSEHVKIQHHSQDCEKIPNSSQFGEYSEQVQDIRIQDCSDLQNFSAFKIPSLFRNENSNQNMKMLADVACKHINEKQDFLAKSTYLKEAIPMSENDSNINIYYGPEVEAFTEDNKQTSICETKNEDEIIDVENSSNTSIKVLEDLEDLDKYKDFNAKYADNIIQDLCQILDNNKEKDIIETADLISDLSREENIEKDHTEKTVSDTNGEKAEMFENKSDDVRTDDTIKNYTERNHPFQPSTTEEFLDYYEKFIEDIKKADVNKITSGNKNKTSKKKIIKNKIVVNFNFKNASEKYASKIERTIHKIRNTVNSNSFNSFWSEVTNLSNLKVENSPTTQQIFIEPKNKAEDFAPQTSIAHTQPENASNIETSFQNSASQTSKIYTKDQQTYVDFNTTENNEIESNNYKKNATTEPEENRNITVTMNEKFEIVMNQHSLIIQYLKELNNKLDKNTTVSVDENETNLENKFYAGIENNAVKKIRTYSRKRNILSEIENNNSDKVGETSSFDVRNAKNNDTEIVNKEKKTSSRRSQVVQRRRSKRLEIKSDSVSKLSPLNPNSERSPILLRSNKAE